MKEADYIRAYNVMLDSFIGVEILSNIELLKFAFPENIPDIPFPITDLEQKKEDYLLILGISKFEDGTPVTIRNIKNKLGSDPSIYEPCFYNQDWYENERFIDEPMIDGWYLIRKNVHEDSRAVQPEELMKRHSFPSAITCTYSFFVTWLGIDEKLWYHDFVWCKDTDHNGDRIYVGKYHDIDGMNKNGFSIHRHLSLRSCYACI